MEPKTYVLDTNVLMEDPAALYQFGQNLVVVPIEILWELDGLKTASGSHADRARSKKARAAIRSLEKLRTQGSLPDGIPVNQGGLVRVVVADKGTVDSVCSLLRNHTSNQRDIGIIATAFGLSDAHEVVLVSNDIGVRVAANIIGVNAIEYQSPNPYTLYEGYREVKLSAKRSAELAEGKAVAVPASLTPRLHPREAVSVKSGTESEVLGIVSGDGALIEPLSPKAIAGVLGIDPLDARQRCALHLLLDPAISLVTISGTAGTGKTLLALAAGLFQVRSEVYKRVLFARPTVPMGEDLGALPGTLAKKLGPWLGPMGDNLLVIQQALAEREWSSGIRSSAIRSGGTRGVRDKPVHTDVLSDLIEVQALQHLRGRSLPGDFFIIDEAQNLNHADVKTILTRAAEGTKIVLLGDLDQIDNKMVTKTTNGLSSTVENFRAEFLAAHMTLTEGQRSALATLAARIM